MNRKSNNALILFVKAPRLGTVKTRLQPELTAAQSLQLYQAMVEDLVHGFQDVDFCDLKIFFHPADAPGEMRDWLGNEPDFFPQQGHDLGARMYQAIADMIHQNYHKAVLIGSDIPTLDLTTVVQAFTSLDEYDVVLGPCNDGGYYLIGMKQPYIALFKDIAWSTHIVLQQTIKKARTVKLKIGQLAKQSDIDTYTDILALWRFFKKNNRTDDFSSKSKTYQVLKKYFEAENTAFITR
jgi:rSAM/selenodomain-associated transferase 1